MPTGSPLYAFQRSRHHNKTSSLSSFSASRGRGLLGQLSKLPAFKLTLKPPSPQTEGLPKPELKADLESSSISHSSAGSATSNLCVTTFIEQWKSCRKPLSSSCCLLWSYFSHAFGGKYKKYCMETVQGLNGWRFLWDWHSQPRQSSAELADKEICSQLLCSSETGRGKKNIFAFFMLNLMEQPSALLLWKSMIHPWYHWISNTCYESELLCCF